MAVSYLPLTGLSSMIALRSSGVIGPIRAEGGRTITRSTIAGVPLPSRNETSASPLPSSMMTLVVSSFGIGPERLGRGRNCLLVARGEGAQRMLHAVAKLAEHPVRHVDRILRHEIDADALGADQPHHLLDLVHQSLRRVIEEQMRLVEEEHELRLRQVAGPPAAPRTARTASRAGRWHRAAGSAAACRPPGY